jgi:hypothetical protein
MANLTTPRDKTKEFLAQKKKVYAAFFSRPMTMLQASRTTGIMRENICRYVRDLRKSHSICIVQEAIDPLTGFRAAYLSTDPRYFPTAQTKLFE